MFDPLNDEFGFKTDAAALEQTALCEIWYGPGSMYGEDAFDVPWLGPVWLNPPYGHNVGWWVAKARHEQQRGVTSVLLLSSNTETIWFQDIVMRYADEVRFIRGRVYFIDPATGKPPRSAKGDFTPAPKGSVVVVFRGNGPRDGCYSAKFSGMIQERDDG